MTWLHCNQRSYIWIFGWTLREDFSTYMCLFNCQRKNKNIIYANVYRNTINDGDSQTSPLPIFPEGGGDVCTQATQTLRNNFKLSS